MSQIETAGEALERITALQEDLKKGGFNYMSMLKHIWNTGRGLTVTNNGPYARPSIEVDPIYDLLSDAKDEVLLSAYGLDVALRGRMPAFHDVSYVSHVHPYLKRSARKLGLGPRSHAVKDFSLRGTTQLIYDTHFMLGRLVTPDDKPVVQFDAQEFVEGIVSHEIVLGMTPQ